jgi:hypothetical protein
MSTQLTVPHPTEESLAAEAAALPVRKRKFEEDEKPEAEIKTMKTEPEADAAAAVSAFKPMDFNPAETQEVVVKARGVRLEQNRKVSTLFALGEHYWLEPS